MTDSTERDRVQAEIVRTGAGTDPFAAAVRATRMPMIITDPRQADNPIIFANDAFCRLTGYSREEILGHNCRFLQGPGTDRAVVEQVRDAITRREPIEIELQNHRKNGSTFWNRLLVAPVFSVDGELSFFFASQYDVTLEREQFHNLDDALRRDEGVLDALVRSSSEVRYRISADWSSLRQLAGGDFLADTDGINSDWIQQYIPEEDRQALRTEIERAIRTRTTYDIEHRVYLKDGSVGWAASRAVPLLDDRGEIVEWYGAASNITDRKRSEAALRASEEALRGSEAFWRGLFERLDEGFMIVELVRDAAGVARTWRFIEVNAAFERLTGLAYADCRGRTIDEVVPAIEREWKDIHIRVAETGQPAALRMPVSALRHVYDVRASRIGPDRVGVLFQEVSSIERDEVRRAALLELNDRILEQDDLPQRLCQSKCTGR